MADDPMHDDATTGFLFQCHESDLFAVSRDPTGGNIPREECTEGWLLRRPFDSVCASQFPRLSNRNRS